MNLTVKRAIAAMLATLLIVFSFASCKKDDAGEEITRGADAIAAPETTATTAAPTSDTTATTAAPATSNTTAATKKSNQGGGTGSAGGSVDQISNQTGLATAFRGRILYGAGQLAAFGQLYQALRCSCAFGQYDVPDHKGRF